MSLPVPRFYLYGEAPKAVDAQFVHLETIKDRSGPARGIIRPHQHSGLNHVFLIERGSGLIDADGATLPFSGAQAVFVPSGIVHGFRFAPDVRGYVLTIASTYLKDIQQRRIGLAAWGETLEVIALNNRRALNDLRQWIVRLHRELVWAAPAQKAAAETCLSGLLIGLYRLRHHSHHSETGDPARPHLLTRFHELIEAHYKTARPLEAYLADLKVSEPQLRYACEKAGEAPPMQMVMNRRLIEARRLLIYSDLRVTECALSLGFDDPAYFSRLFTRHTGQSPTRWRLAHRL